MKFKIRKNINEASEQDNFKLYIFLNTAAEERRPLNSDDLDDFIVEEPTTEEEFFEAIEDLGIVDLEDIRTEEELINWLEGQDYGFGDPIIYKAIFKGANIYDDSDYFESIKADLESGDYEESLDEEAEEKVSLEYPNLTIQDVVVRKADTSYNPNAIEPPEDDVQDITTECILRVPKEDVIDVIIEDVIWDEDLSDEEALAKINNNFDEYFEKYKDEILEFFRADAEEKAVENYFNESLNEASYGGAYDIEDDQYFTREELNDFGYDIEDALNNTADINYHIPFNYAGCWADGNKIEIVMECDGVEEVVRFRADFRKIKYGKDLTFKYGPEVIQEFERKFRNDLPLDESLNEEAKADFEVDFYNVDDELDNDEYLTTIPVSVEEVIAKYGKSIYDKAIVGINKETIDKENGIKSD